MVANIVDRLKSTAHFNVVFEDHAFDMARIQSVLEWLNARAVTPLPAEALERHMAEIRRRNEGGRSLDQVAAETGERLLALRAPRLFDHYDFGRYDMGDVVVSVDLLDAAGELEMPEPIAGMALEVFGTYGREDRSGAGLRRVLREMTETLPVEFAFGGHVSFTGRYAASLNRPQKALKNGTKPWHFLWPLTFTKDPTITGRVSPSLPVHLVEPAAGGVLIQPFETLVTGDEDKYREAAHMLGLTSVWELKPVRAAVSAKPGWLKGSGDVG